MASPFRIFRKYQKTLLVVAGVVLMFVFVIGDSLVAYLTGSRNARGEEHDAGAVAVHWDGGSLTNRQLSELVVRRKILNGFLKQVQHDGELSAYQAGVEPPPLRVQQLLGPETPQQGVEQSVVQTRLFADAARDAGMKVSDETLTQYLDELGRRNVGREKMRAILHGMQSGRGRASIDYVVDALREEMLAGNYIGSQRYAFYTVTPQQSWEDWRRVNDRVVIEAAAVPAESVLSDVKKPSEAEIEAFFETYKDRESSPEIAYGTTELPSPTPGFKTPRKIDLQFVQANYDALLAKAEEKVTDAEVAKYYDEHKTLFEKADTGLMEETGKKKDGQKSEPPATKSDAKEGKGTPEPKSTDGEKKSGEPDAKKPTEPATPDTKPSDEGKQPAKNNDAPSANKDGKTEAAPADEKKSSYRAHPLKHVFQLAAFEQDASKKDSPAADKASASAEPKPEKSPEKPAETSETKAAPATDKDAAKAAPATPEAKAGDGAAKQSAALSANPVPAATKKPVEYQPLSEVKDLIRRQMAEGKVAEQLGQLTNQIQTQLESEFNGWFNEKLSAQAEKQEPPPAPKSLSDLAPIAEKNGLKHNRTGPKSRLEMRETPLGKSSVADSGRRLLPLLFAGHELDLYQPVTTVDLDGNHYIVIKMSDEPGRVPTLAEVRDEVIRAWKKQRAAELAQKRAEELAKKAQDAKSPLTSFFAEDKAVKVVRTDPFSELTGGDVVPVNGQFQQQPYRLGQPDGIVAPGPGFMKRVFELKDGEVAVALNHDHSIAYVIRLVEHQPGLNELRTAFLGEADSWSGRNSMTQGHVQETFASLRNDIIAGSNLKWDRNPDKAAQEEQPDEG